MTAPLFYRSWDGNGLSCPVCQSQRLRVVDTRPNKGTIRRRRKCVTCEFRWHTMEIACDFYCVPADERFDELAWTSGNLRPVVGEGAS